jgi:hypothetical protein
MSAFLGALAQSVEQLAFNQLVVRSSRTRPTIFFFSLCSFVASLRAGAVALYFLVLLESLAVLLTGTLEHIHVALRFGRPWPKRAVQKHSQTLLETGCFVTYSNRILFASAY